MPCAIGFASAASRLRLFPGLPWTAALFAIYDDEPSTRVLFAASGAAGLFNLWLLLRWNRRT